MHISKGTFIQPALNQQATARTNPWWVFDVFHDCRWKMASCCRPSSPLFPSSTSTERLGWSSTSLSLMSFGRSWWSESLPSQRARTRTGASSLVCGFEYCFLKEPAWTLLSFIFCRSAYRYGKLEELLEKSFPLVKMPSIQPVVMQVLKHLPKASVVRAISLLLKTKNCCKQGCVQYWPVGSAGVI